MGKAMAAGTFTKKAIPTEYKGITFKSKSEAFWAVFFDACDVEWQYEEQGYRVGVPYLPDFHLHNVINRQDGDGDGEDFYFEVKGKLEDDDLEKIVNFTGLARSDTDATFQTPMLVVPAPPYGDTMTDRECIVYKAWKRTGYFHNACFMRDGEDHYAYPVIRVDGKLWITRGDYRWKVDEEKTQRAYFIANKTSFEYGHKPTYVKVREAMKSDDAAKIYAEEMQGEVAKSDQTNKFDEAMRLFGDKQPSVRNMLRSAKNGGISGNVVTLLFDGYGRMVRPLIERNAKEMEDAFSKVYGQRMHVRMLDNTSKSN